MRRGFLLPSTLLLLCILFLLAFTRHFFSRHQMQMVGHLADYEKAYHLCSGGLEVGKGYLDETVLFFNNGAVETFPKRDKAPEHLKKIIAALLDSDGLPPKNGSKVELSPEVLKDLTKGKKENVSLKVLLEVKPIASLWEATAGPGIVVDEREMDLYFFVHAESKVEDSTCRVSYYREGKFVHILPPVVGKFSLFLRQPGVLRPNALKDSMKVDLLDNSPLVVQAGLTKSLKSIVPGVAQNFFDDQGWIFLGGMETWAFSLSMGGNSPALQDGIFSREMFFFPINPPEPLSSKSHLKYYASQSPLFRELRDTDLRDVFALKPSADVDYSAILHLEGSAGAPTPTLVVGNVTRKWGLIQGLFNSKSKEYSPLPFLDEAAFSGNRWPGVEKPKTIDILKKNFSHSYDDYSRRMSDLSDEPYNTGNMYCLKYEEKDPARTLIFDRTKMPAGATLPPPSKKLQANGLPGDFFQMVYGGSYSLKDDKGKSLFNGGDLSALENFSFLEKRAGFSFPDGATFLKKIKRDKRKKVLLEGVVKIGGNLEIAEPLEFGTNGCGMILVNGTIKIKSRLRTTMDDPVTLISLKNDIFIETSETVEAGLIALGGKIHFGGTTSIIGMIAAKELDLPRASTSNKREIVYNLNFDVTKDTNYRRFYRFSEQGKGLTFVH